MKSRYKRRDLGAVSSARSSRPAGADRKARGASRAASILALLSVAALVAPARLEAKSLYVIASISIPDHPTPIQAYNINPDGTLAFQAEYGIQPQGSGTVGIAMDSYSGGLFITFEDASTIMLLNGQKMNESHVISAPLAVNLAGIVYDHGRELLYAVDRRTQNLYSYRWDATRRILLPIPNSPFKLADATAWGITLDETGDLLYVGNNTNKVTVYSTWDWRLMRTITVGQTAISVAVDPVRGYLYYAAGFRGSHLLNRYDLARNVEKEVEIAPDAGVIGITVDTDTGMVYVTTGVNQAPGGDDLVVLNSELEIVQTIENIGSATGLVVPPLDVGYNPLNLTKTIKGAAVQEPNDRTLPPIVIGDDVTYVIGFDYQDQGLTDVLVVDRLPAEVTFVDATDNGSSGRYDEPTHTYTWRNPPVTTARANLQLVGRLKPATLVGTHVLNIVTLDTDKTAPTTMGVEAIATAAVYRPLHVVKTVVRPSGTGTDSNNVYVSPGEEFTYEICVDNKDNAHAVGTITIRDNLPPEVDFVSATPDGTYDSASHTCVWSLAGLSAGDSRCVALVVRLDQNATPGAVVTNRASIHNEQTGDKDDTADVVVAQRPLELRKTIVSGAGGTPDERGRLSVNAGGEVTYALTFKNPSAEQTVTLVSLVDALPPETDFVRAEVGESIGSYDPDAHTYTWLCNPVAPLEEVTMKLTVRVDGQTQPNTVISNWALVSSKETPSAKARVDAVVRGEAVQVPADLFFKPPHLFRNNSKDTDTLMVILHLPEGCGKELIANTPLVLTPGDIRATSQSVFGTSTQGKIVCFFPTQAILAATQGYGGFRLTVTGQLTDGRAFVGKGVLSIFRFGGGP